MISMYFFCSILSGGTFARFWAKGQVDTFFHFWKKVTLGNDALNLLKFERIVNMYILYGLHDWLWLRTDMRNGSEGRLETATLLPTAAEKISVTVGWCLSNGPSNEFGIRTHPLLHMAASFRQNQSWQSTAYPGRSRLITIARAFVPGSAHH